MSLARGRLLGIGLAVLAALLLAAAAITALPSIASMPTKRCGEVQAKGKTFKVRSHLARCRFARRASRNFLREGTRPDGWTCIKYDPDQTSIAFICRKGGKDIYAIRK